MILYSDIDLSWELLDNVIINVMLCSVTDLRLQLLDVQHNQDLIRSLYGLLMLLPQSEAFKLLRFRLDCIPHYQLLALKEKYVPIFATISHTMFYCIILINWDRKREIYCKTQLKSVYQQTQNWRVFFPLYSFYSISVWIYEGDNWTIINVLIWISILGMR